MKRYRLWVLSQSHYFGPSDTNKRARKQQNIFLSQNSNVILSYLKKYVFYEGIYIYIALRLNFHI